MPQQLSKDEILALNADKRIKCKVYTRVMGYHRPVESFNVGKVGEHRERQLYSEHPEKGARHHA